MANGGGRSAVALACGAAAKKGRAEVLGLKGFGVTQRAREVAEAAGFHVKVTLVRAEDLPYLRASIGTSGLPAVLANGQTITGMNAIRSYFGKAHPGGNGSE